MCTSRFTFADATGIDADGGQQYLIDSRAMRKVEEGQDLIEVIETTDVTSGVITFTFMRTLIKLH